VADVRRATAADIPELLDMARELHAESPAFRDEPFEPEVVRRWLAQRMATVLLADDNAVFVTTAGGHLTGVLVALVIDSWFNRSRTAAELTLYVRPQHRGGRALPALVRAYKAWARAQGAAKAALGVSTGIHPERTVHAYRKLGFKLDGYNVITSL
jgi:GNAT superfamily N-acetyltransferase